MSNIRAWIVSLRLRTLPLALASIGMGSFLAASYGTFNRMTLILTSFTAILLQILSNLANDYGDYKSGADNEKRIGPQRALQTGVISLSAMRNAIIIVSILTLICGSALLYTAKIGLTSFMLFFISGLLCIAAAIKYTIGKNPYGYAGLGDVAVFIFFGIVGVGGTYYLQTHEFFLPILLPACALGFLSAGVLNVNNMRDIESDAATGKKTVAVRMGLAKAKKYHLCLIIAAFLCLIIFTFMVCYALSYFSIATVLFLLTIPLFIYHLLSIFKHDSSGMDKYLKQLAIFTVILVLVYGTGLL